MKAMHDLRQVLSFKMMKQPELFSLWPWYLFLGLGLAMMSCGKKQEPVESYGIGAIEIKMESSTLGELNNSVGGKRPFPARLRIDGEVYDVELAYAGKSSLYSYKRSWQVYFLSAPYRGRHEYRISSQQRDPSMLRSLIGFEFFRDQGVLAPESEPRALYLNDRYLGLHTLIEPVDEEFFTVRGIRILELYKAKFANADFSLEYLPKLTEAFSVKTELNDYAAIRRLYEIVNDSRLTSTERRRKLERLLDVEQYLNYIACAVYLNHVDGFDNNFFLARFASDQKFRIVPWDLDRLYEGSETFFTGETLFGRNELTAAILSVPEFKQMYLERMAELTSDATFAQVEESFAGYKAAISQAYAADPILRHYDQDQLATRLRRNMNDWIAALQTDVLLLTTEPDFE